MRGAPLVLSLIFALAYGPRTVRAQPPPPPDGGWTAIDTSALPSDSITAIAWPYVGTGQGLAYYDGTGFVTGASTAGQTAIAASPVRFVDGGVVANGEGAFYVWADASGLTFESVYDYYSDLVGCYFDPGSGDTVCNMFGPDASLDATVFEDIEDIEIGSQPPYEYPVIDLVTTDGEWISLYPPNATCTGDPSDSACFYTYGTGRSGVNDILRSGGTLWASVPGPFGDFDAGIYEYAWVESTQVLGGQPFDFGEWERTGVPFQRDRTGLCLENTVDMAFGAGTLYAAYTAFGETETGDECEDPAFRLAAQATPRRGRMGSYDGSTWTRSRTTTTARLAGCAPTPFPEGVPVAADAVGNVVMMGLAPATLFGCGGGVAWTTDITDPGAWTSFQVGDPGVPWTTNEITAVDAFSDAGRPGFVVGTSDGLAVYVLPDVAPSPVSPAPDATGAPSTPLFSWAPSPGATGSTVALALSPDFASPVGTWTTTTASVSVPDDQPLAPNTPYYWRARSTLAGGGESPWSEPRSFTTGTATIVRHGRGRDVVDIDAAGTPYTTSDGSVLSYEADAWTALDVPAVTAGSSARLALSAGPAGVVWVGGGTTLEIQGPNFYNVFGGGLGRLAGGVWETVVPVPATGDFEAAGYPAVAGVSADVAWACEEVVEETGDPISSTLVRFTAGTREDLWALPCAVLAAVDGSEVWVAEGATLDHVTAAGTASVSAPGIVSAIALAGDGTVWIGTDDGLGQGGIARYDPGTDTWTSLPWPWSGVTAVGAAGEVVWAGAAEGLARYAEGAWTLWSASNGTLPPGPVPSVASVTGEAVWAMSGGGAVAFSLPSNTVTAIDLTVAGPEGWHMMASPLGPTTVADHLAGLTTVGFPGATVPAGDPSVLFYDEAAACDADPATEPPPCEASTGYAPPAASTASVPSGAGLFAYLYADDDPAVEGVQGGFPKMLSLTGAEPALPFAFPALSYTDTGSAADDGWTLLGNPLAAPLDWDAPGWTRTAVSGSVYTYDPSVGEYLTWNGVVGTLGGGQIPVGRGFWVQATGDGPALVAPEAARVAGATDATATAPTDVDVVELRLTGTTAAGQRGSTVFVTFGAGGGDAYALDPPTATYVVAAVARPDDGAPLAVAALPSLSEAAGPAGLRLGLALSHGGLTDGAMTWTWPRTLAEGSGWTAVLVDTETGAEVDLATATEYAFTVDPAAGQASGRSAPSLAAGPVPTGRRGPGRFVLSVAPSRAVSADGTPTVLTVDAPSPNPARGPVALRYALPEPASVEVAVFDALGRRVARLAPGEQGPGRYAPSLETGALAAGVYVVRTTVRPTSGGEGRVLTHKLTVVR